MPVEKRFNAEPVPGYRLIERLGAGGFGEVWKCEAPGGIFKAIKFVYGNLNGLDSNSGHAEEELRALQLIKSIRHPFLLAIDRVENVGGELVIITELADRNLHELGESYVAQGNPGIPHDELLDYLREVAEVLDLLNQKFDLQHLDIKPHNLFLVCNHVKVADFGLVNSLTGGMSDKLHAKLNAVTPLYAAPELFLGKLSRQCDQYSLAIVFQELLTGTLPFPGNNMRQLLVQHTQAQPDLQSLSPHDRAVVARALSKAPEARFASCLDFVRALQMKAAPAPMRNETCYDIALEEPPQGIAETVPLRASDTDRLSGAARPPLPRNVLANWRFKESLLNSPLMEVWKAQTPEGKSKRVQFVYGLGGTELDKLQEALTRLQSVQHPALFAPTIVHVELGRVILATDAIRELMRDRFNQCQSRKQPGIPRSELIDYIRAAAEALDCLYQQHNIQHLNLNPRNLVLDNGWLQLAEFGYAQLLWAPAGQDIGQRNARYAAPELFASLRPLTDGGNKDSSEGGMLRRHCDQYSLALIYAEMLTGVHPFQGLGPQSYLAKKTPPNLERLPDLDREVILRALDPDPKKRWSNCVEMLLALEGTSVELNRQLQGRPDHFIQMVESERHSKRKKALSFIVTPTDLNQMVADLINAHGGNVTPLVSIQPTLSAKQDVVRCSFQAGVPLGAAQERLQVFCQQMCARIGRHTESSCTMHFDLPTTFWQRLFRQRPKLELSVEMARVHPMSATPIEINAELRVLNCTRKQATKFLEKMSLEVMEYLQQHLIINSEKRTRDRLLWPHTITIIPIDHEGQSEEPIECRGKDLSQTGIGFYLPHELSTPEILIEVSNTLHPPAVRIPATLVRAKRCADGWYDVGAIFRLPIFERTYTEVMG